MYYFHPEDRALWYCSGNNPNPLHVVVVKQETVKGAFPNPFWDEHHYRIKMKDGTERVVFYRSMFPDFDYYLQRGGREAVEKAERIDGAVPGGSWTSPAKRGQLEGSTPSGASKLGVDHD